MNFIMGFPKYTGQTRAWIFTAFMQTVYDNFVLRHRRHHLQWHCLWHKSQKTMGFTQCHRGWKQSWHNIQPWSFTVPSIMYKLQILCMFKLFQLDDKINALYVMLTLVFLDLKNNELWFYMNKSNFVLNSAYSTTLLYWITCLFNLWTQ